MKNLFSLFESTFRLWRAKNAYERIAVFINKGETVLDLGAGDCLLIQKLVENKAVKAAAVDVVDHNKTAMPLTIYDGTKLPFADKSFDACLIMTVLHHCADPVQVLREAIRVTRNKIIIEEDVHHSTLQKQTTFFIDYLFNEYLSGTNAPHNNLSKSQWEKLFKELGLVVIQVTSYKRVFLVLEQVVFVLKVT